MNIYTCVNCGHESYHPWKGKCNCKAKTNYKEYIGSEVTRSSTWKGDKLERWMKPNTYYYIGGTKNGIKKNIKPHWCQTDCPVCGLK